jgi:hypothetical protein
MIELSEPIAFKAVELALDYGLRPADSLHAASAIFRRVDELQRWERAYSKVAGLIPVDDPKQISAQANMFASAPRPEHFSGEAPMPAQSEGTKREANAADEGGLGETDF